LRYKIAARGKFLKLMKNRKSSCNLRYKITGANNPLF